MNKEVNKSGSSDEPKKIFLKDSGLEFEIPVEGSLGLLALGAIGIKAWREKRKSANENNQKGK